MQRGARQRVREEFNRISQTYARTVRRQRLGDLGWLPLSDRPRVLEVACGPGTYSVRLAERAGWLVCLDLAEAMLQWTGRRRHRGAQGPVLLQADANYLPFASEEFDLCFCAFSFAHFPRPKQVLREMARVLRRDGSLAILDVLAPANPLRRRLLNELETMREDCYTRVREMKAFRRLFDGLPLQLEHCHTEKRCVSLHRWLAASHLKPGSAEFRGVRRLFRSTAQQLSVRGAPASAHAAEVLPYTVAHFLLRKTG